MITVLWIALVLLLVALYVYLTRYKQVSLLSYLPSSLANSLPILGKAKGGGIPQTLPERIASQTEREKAKTEELRKVLEAKKLMVEARSANDKLRKEIEDAGKGVADKPEAKRPHNQYRDI